MDNHNEIVCQVCGSPLSEGAVVYCSRCKTPHHKDCWSYNKKCSTFGCHARRCIDELPSYEDEDSPSNLMTFESSGEVWVGEEQIKSKDKPQSIPSVRKKRKPGRKAKARYEKRIKTQLKEKSQRKKDLLTKDRSPGNYSQPSPNDDGGHYSYKRAGLFSGLYWRLDIDVPMEEHTRFLSVALSILAILINQQGTQSGVGSYNVDSARIFAFIAATLAFIRIFTDYTYILDNGRRKLAYARSFMGYTTMWQICRYHEISRVGVCATRIMKSRWYNRHDRYYVYTYSVLLALSDNTSIRVSERYKDLGKVNNLARVLATHLCVKFIAGKETTGSLVPGYRSPALLPIDDDGQKPFKGGDCQWPIFASLQSWDYVLVIPLLICSYILFLR